MEAVAEQAPHIPSQSVPPKYCPKIDCKPRKRHGFEEASTGPYLLSEQKLKELEPLYKNIPCIHPELGIKSFDLPVEHLQPYFICQQSKYYNGIGFHWDYLENIAKHTNVQITVKEIGKHGVYAIEWGLPGQRLKPSTMFPAHWLVEEALIATREAALNSTLTKGTNGWKVIGRAKNDVAIEIFFHPNSEIASFYPIVEPIR